MNLGELDHPTIIQVTAPWCLHCRSMHQDMIDVSEEFAGRVDVVAIDVSSSPEAVRGLAVKGTPTLIGVKGGNELFRMTGRRNRSQLTEMFETVENGRPLSSRHLGDTGLALATGSLLCGIGVIAGPVWSLVVIGVAVLGYGVMRSLRGRNA